MRKGAIWGAALGALAALSLAAAACGGESGGIDDDFCHGESDGTRCNDGNPCTDGDVCGLGICRGEAVADGEVCDDANACTVAEGFCAAGVCAAAARDCASDVAACIADGCRDVDCDDGNACTEDRVGDTDCEHTPVSCADPGIACHEAVCDAATGLCALVNQENGTECDDADPCTEGDVCAAGSCGGKAKDCSSGPCDAGLCDAATGVCSSAPAANGTACNDGNPCSAGAVCTSGLCGGGALVPTGSPCDDGDACTKGDACEVGLCIGSAVDCSGLTGACVVGVCDPASGCKTEPVKDGLACTDGDACTGGDACKAGVCVGPIEACPCAGLADGVACDDNNPCTKGETCKAQQCVGTALDCSSLDTACAAGACDTATGACVALPRPFGTPCNDGKKCTDDDFCSDGACIGSLKVCPTPDNPCQASVCAEASGTCKEVARPNGTPCNDGDGCTGADQCKAGACQGPIQACTQECKTKGLGAACDDGNACTGAGTCSATQGGAIACVGKPTVECAATSPCKLGYCKYETGSCAQVANVDGLPCDDGSGCTLQDACAAGTCAGVAKPLCGVSAGLCESDAANDEARNAQPLSQTVPFKTAVVGWISQPSDVDWYRFTAPKGTVLSVQTGPVCGAAVDTTLTLLRATSVVLGEAELELVAFDDDGAGGGWSKVQTKALAEGEYYLHVTGAGPKALGSYALTIDATNPPECVITADCGCPLLKCKAGACVPTIASELEPNDEGPLEGGPILGMGGQLAGDFASPADGDWYWVLLVQDTVVDIAAHAFCDGGAVKPRLQLYSPGQGGQPSLVAETLGGAGPEAARIQDFVPPVSGAYGLLVRDQEGILAPYRVTLGPSALACDSASAPTCLCADHVCTGFMCESPAFAEEPISPAQPAKLPASVKAHGLLAPAHDVDSWEVALDAGTWDVVTSPWCGSDVDTDLSVFGPGQVLLGSDKDSGVGYFAALKGLVLATPTTIRIDVQAHGNGEGHFGLEVVPGTECTGDGCCDPGVENCACVPACAGKACGPDGCGGTCGTCASGTLCLKGSCTKDPCTPSPCTEHGACGGLGACLCDLGYTGQTCGACAPGYVNYPQCTPDLCHQNTCSGIGTCDKSTGNCFCPDGLAGASCQFCAKPGVLWPGCTQLINPPDPLCEGVTCSGFGTCGAGGVCACLPGFTGPACAQCSTPGDLWPDCAPCVADADCDDGNPCTTAVCGPDATCATAALANGAPCDDGVATCQSGACVGCKTAQDCNDQNGCTADTCDVASGRCSHDACDVGEASWNALTTVPSVATAAAPYTFQIPGWSQPVRFHRTGNLGLIQSYTPPASDLGSVPSDLVSGFELAWDGAISYVDVLSDGQPIGGSVTFEFGVAAASRGPSWHFLLGIGGTGGAPGEGPTTIVCDRPMALVATIDAFASQDFAAFEPPSTLFGSTGTVDGLSVFSLPSNTVSVTCTLSGGGELPDPHGYFVGMVNLAAAACSGSGAAATCATNTCGDGNKSATEGCDDGDKSGSDGCSAACQVESGYACTTPGVLSVCACAPQCTNAQGAPKQCGSDGCGGTCGECAEGSQCSASGLCECVPSCAGKSCGDDGCGGSCGACSAGSVCDGGHQCTFAPCCAGTDCCAAGETVGCSNPDIQDCVCAVDPFCCDVQWDGVCADGAIAGCGQGCQVCTPSCAGKSCGPDGCGGSCGVCAAPAACNGTGACACTPQCAGKSCGPDGCGGTCGTCAAPAACNGSGACVCTPNAPENPAAPTAAAAPAGPAQHPPPATAPAPACARPNAPPKPAAPTAAAAPAATAARPRPATAPAPASASPTASARPAAPTAAAAPAAPATAATPATRRPSASSRPAVPARTAASPPPKASPAATTPPSSTASAPWTPSAATSPGTRSASGWPSTPAATPASAPRTARAKAAAPTAAAAPAETATTPTAAPPTPATPRPASAPTTPATRARPRGTSSPTSPPPPASPTPTPSSSPASPRRSASTAPATAASSRATPRPPPSTAPSRPPWAAGPSSTGPASCPTSTSSATAASSPAPSPSTSARLRPPAAPRGTTSSASAAPAASPARARPPSPATNRCSPWASSTPSARRATRASSRRRHSSARRTPSTASASSCCRRAPSR
ncbi:MAG: hypothetical protein R3F39_15170 [Myxococcota bacterium]